MFRRFLSLILVMAGAVIAMASDTAPRIMRVDTHSGTHYDLSISHGLTMSFSAQTLTLSNPDKTLTLDIPDVKGFGYHSDYSTILSPLAPDNIAFDGRILSISTSGRQDEYRIFTSAGLSLSSGKFSDKTEVDLSEFPSGSYILQLSSGKTLHFLKK